MLNSDETTRLDIAARLMGYASRSRYQTRARSLFNGIDLTGKHVLEVGCGTGAWAIWAALHGAETVVGIDPASNGSTGGTTTRFKQAIETLNLSAKVVATSDYLQQLPMHHGPFDVIVMYNVINHLDEPAVLELHESQTAYDRYLDHLRDIHNRLRPGGWLIAADAARTNFWPFVGMHSPFAPTIEWKKHQDPKTWCRVLEDAGFSAVAARWSPIQPLPRLTSNRLAQFFTFSHFVLRARANPVPVLEPGL